MKEKGSEIGIPHYHIVKPVTKERIKGFSVNKHGLKSKRDYIMEIEKHAN